MVNKTYYANSTLITRPRELIRHRCHFNYTPVPSAPLHCSTQVERNYCPDVRYKISKAIHNFEYIVYFYSALDFKYLIEFHSSGRKAKLV